MANKPHLYFKNPQEGVVTYKQPRRYAGITEDDTDIVKNYTPLKNSFKSSIKRFFADKQKRERKRNQTLQVPAHIDYIEIDFFDYFDTTGFENKYIADFGLSPIRHTDFNTKVLFAITDTEKFKSFIGELEKFINTPDNVAVPDYNPNIKYIEKFDFLSTEKIIEYTGLKQVVVLKLVEYVPIIREVQQSLYSYLEAKNIIPTVNPSNSTIELTGVANNIVQEIADNFDIIQSINSHLAGIIRPSNYNLPERSFGFTITNSTASLPVIGIIDTGISNQTPLVSLLINRNTADYDITGTGVYTDNVNHGTGVAAIAALGNTLYPQHRGSFEADAKLLSIKVMDTHRGSLHSGQVTSLIEKAYAEHGVKVFVLTIAYTDFKKYNSSISDYATALDLLSHKLDILIIISVGNNMDLTTQRGQRAVPVNYPSHFAAENTNLCIPSESMNNISVGAIADNLENNTLSGITPDKSFPAIYTRKYHLNFEDESLSRNKKNKYLFKPDVIHCGGDYDSTLTDNTGVAMKFLSAQTGEFFARNIGTSFSAPLVANLMAKIMRQYPQMNSQTTKALVINSASQPNTGNFFNNVPASTRRHIFGHGTPADELCLFSNEDRITFAMEDSIKPEQIKSFPLKLPAYLNEISSEKSILEITATLCFKFKPLQNNQLAYCPLHITFGIGKNLPLEATNSRKLNDSKVGESLIHSWAQDYYYKPKPLSNCQKISFKVNKQKLIDESNTFKIVLSSKFHKLLNQTQRREYNAENPFSLVITISELPINGENTGRLYNEMLLINDLSVIAELEADLDI